MTGEDLRPKSSEGEPEAYAGKLVIQSEDATPLILARNPGAIVILSQQQTEALRAIEAAAETPQAE